MGDLIQFRPRARDAIAIENVQIIGTVPAGARIIAPSATAESISGHGVTVFYEIERGQGDDTAPAEYCGQEIE